MDVTAWWQRWLARHPLKGLSEEDRARYVAEVMRRVRALQPSPVVRPWVGGEWAERIRVATQSLWDWPRLAVPALATAAGLLVVWGVVWSLVGREAPLRIAALPTRPSPAPRTQIDIRAPQPTTAIHQASDATLTDEEWIFQTLQLLEEVEEDGATAPLEVGDDEEEWLEELEWLDEQELMAAT